MSNRTANNRAIAKLVATLKASPGTATDEDKAYLMQYTGDGGLASKGVGTRGALYEYYTPIPIVEAMMALVHKHGWNGTGRVLEPSCGIGRFLKYIDPHVCTVDAYEFAKDNTISFDIAQICFPWANIANDYFESIFYENGRRVEKNNLYDLVIGNPPYGEFSGYYAGDNMEGKRYPKTRQYEDYFIAAGIDLLKPGGILAYIIPSTWLAKGYADNSKPWVEHRADLMDFYRLPAGTFPHTRMITDIVILKKK